MSELIEAKPPVCANCCKFRNTNIFDQGQCRRNAPVMVQKTITETRGNGWEHAAVWPSVRYADWCGEFTEGEAYEDQNQ